jgi:biotin transport system substrate-specific component
MHYPSGADAFRPAIRQEALLYDIVLIIGASIFIALSAQIAINVSFSPVPITGQTFAVLLTGVLLGSKRGVLAILLYLFEGISGLPVFAGAGYGLVKLTGPTGGYLIGFVPAAYISGRLAERGWDRQIFKTFLIMSVGTIIIFLCGICWLVRFTGPEHVLRMGFYPFIPGALIKIISATLLLPLGLNFLKSKNKES